MDRYEGKTAEEIISDLNDRILHLENRVEALSKFILKDHIVVYQPQEEGFFDDDLFYKAADIVLETGEASATLLQRRLSIGYARSAKLLDMLEARGIVGRPVGDKPRDILISKKDYEKIKRFNNKDKKE